MIRKLLKAFISSIKEVKENGTITIEIRLLTLNEVAYYATLVLGAIVMLVQENLVVRILEATVIAYVVREGRASKANDGGEDEDEEQ